MSWLFDTAPFITRNHCGPGWTDNLIVLSRLFNFLIFFAYFSIPMTLSFVWLEMRRRARTNVLVHDVQEILRESRWIIVMFVTFIFACGLTHLCDVLVFDWPPYRFFTLIDALTALASVPTAVLLPGIFTRVITLLSRRRDGSE